MDVDRRLGLVVEVHDDGVLVQALRVIHYLVKFWNIAARQEF